MWEDDKIQLQSQCLPIPGRDLESAGLTSFADLTTEDRHIFNQYREIIAKKIREETEWEFPDDFEFVPTSIARQIESHSNCYFRIDLPHAIVTAKILPNPHVTDHSKHVSIHQEPLVSREASITELIL
ncbi:unnamed protein product [Adineta ricciae]|uniref:Uncharacterized protein n=1 Tax=Adineta ricciae TaxID=249248 RepID=A0A814QTY0_ADIRI|nr:unnamed protein product [Adineta ricciae]CAF1124461.1 unnamed protein product [Adineta ricciae]